MPALYCRGLDNAARAKAWLACMVETGVRLNHTLYNTIINARVRAGERARAARWLQAM